MLIHMGIRQIAAKHIHSAKHFGADTEADELFGDSDGAFGE